jgi:hypothetical protein
LATKTIDVGTSLVVPQAQRGPFPAGAPFTQDFAVANNPALSAITFAGDFAAADNADPSKSCQVDVHVVNPDLTLQHVFGFTWQGVPGTNPKDGLPYPSPTVAVTGDPLRSVVGKPCRVTVVLPARMAFGGTVSVS